MNVRITETIVGRKHNNSIDINIIAEHITIREIIEIKVANEVNNYNNISSRSNSIANLTNREIEINNTPKKSRKEIDVEKQIYIALDSFAKSEYYIIVDNTQSENLNQTFQIKENTKIEFIRLTPIVGG